VSDTDIDHPKAHRTQSAGDQATDLKPPGKVVV